MKLKYTNLLGLLAIIGTVAGLVGIGVLYPVHPLLAIPFGLLALGGIVLFVKYVHHFIYYHPLGEIPDEEAKASYRDDE
jgi:TRAP-type mannitol/chloroaromatic compound transport system permease small subunit